MQPGPGEGTWRVWDFSSWLSRLCPSSLWFTLYLADDSMDDIDTDLVKASLTDLLQNLKESERKREDSQVKVDSLQKAVTRIEEERLEMESRLRNLHGEINEMREQKREVEERFGNSQMAITLQVMDTTDISCSSFDAQWKV